MSDALGASTLASQYETRQLPGISGTGQLTPDQLAQINLNDKSSLESLVLGVNLAGIILITVVVSARLAVRRFMIHQFFTDDLLIIVATICTLLVCSLTIVAATYGLGQHVWNLSTDVDVLFAHIKKCIQLMYVANITYACAIAFTKFSIIASYLRIFPHQTLRYIMLFCATIVLGLFIAAIPATILQCRPIAAAWDFSIQDASCYPFVNFLYASTAISVTTDLILCIAPLPYFWKLQLPRRQKVLVSGLFAIGGFAAIACIVRISFLRALVDGVDVTYNLVASVLWTMAECAIGIICVSIPTIRPLLAKLAPSIFGTSRTRGTGTAPSGKGSGLRHRSGGWSSRSNSGKGELGGMSGQIELDDKSSKSGAEWTFSRLGTEPRDHVWDGTGIGTRPGIFMTTQPAARREPRVSLGGREPEL